MGELLSNIQAGRLTAFNGAFWGGEALKTLLAMSLIWKLMSPRYLMPMFGGTPLLMLNWAGGVRMDNRRMCPNCRAFITTSDRVCPYCGEFRWGRARSIGGIPARCSAV